MPSRQPLPPPRDPLPLAPAAGPSKPKRGDSYLQPKRRAPTPPTVPPHSSLLAETVLPTRSSSPSSIRPSSSVTTTATLVPPPSSFASHSLSHHRRSSRTLDAEIMAELDAERDAFLARQEGLRAQIRAREDERRLRELAVAHGLSSDTGSGSPGSTLSKKRVPPPLSPATSSVLLQDTTVSEDQSFDADTTLPRLNAETLALMDADVAFGPPPPRPLKSTLRHKGSAGISTAHKGVTISKNVNMIMYGGTEYSGSEISAPGSTAGLLSPQNMQQRIPVPAPIPSSRVVSSGRSAPPTRALPTNWREPVVGETKRVAAADATTPPLEVLAAPWFRTVNRTTHHPSPPSPRTAMSLEWTTANATLLIDIRRCTERYPGTGHQAGRNVRIEMTRCGMGQVCFNLQAQRPGGDDATFLDDLGVLVEQLEDAKRTAKQLVTSSEGYATAIPPAVALTSTSISRGRGLMGQTLKPAKSMPSIAASKPPTTSRLAAPNSSLPNPPGTGAAMAALAGGRTAQALPTLARRATTASGPSHIPWVPGSHATAAPKTSKALNLVVTTDWAANGWDPDVEAKLPPTPVDLYRENISLIQQVRKIVRSGTGFVWSDEYERVERFFAGELAAAKRLVETDLDLEETHRLGRRGSLKLLHRLSSSQPDIDANDVWGAVRAKLPISPAEYAAFDKFLSAELDRASRMVRQNVPLPPKETQNAAGSIMSASTYLPSESQWVTRLSDDGRAPRPRRSEGRMKESIQETLSSIKGGMRRMAPPSLHRHPSDTSSGSGRHAGTQPPGTDLVADLAPATEQPVEPTLRRTLSTPYTLAPALAPPSVKDGFVISAAGPCRFRAYPRSAVSRLHPRSHPPPTAKPAEWDSWLEAMGQHYVFSIDGAGTGFGFDRRPVSERAMTGVGVAMERRTGAATLLSSPQQVRPSLGPQLAERAPPRTATTSLANPTMRPPPRGGSKIFPLPLPLPLPLRLSSPGQPEHPTSAPLPKRERTAAAEPQSANSVKRAYLARTEDARSRAATEQWVRMQRSTSTIGTTTTIRLTEALQPASRRPSDSTLAPSASVSNTGRIRVAADVDVVSGDQVPNDPSSPAQRAPGPTSTHTHSDAPTAATDDDVKDAPLFKRLRKLGRRGSAEVLPPRRRKGSFADSIASAKSFASSLRARGAGVVEKLGWRSEGDKHVAVPEA